MDATSIRQKFNIAAANGYSFAAVRLPGTTSIHFLYSKQQPALVPVKMLSEGPAQFVCSPYGAGNLAYVLQAESHYENDKLISGEALIPVETDAIFQLQSNLSNIEADQSFYEHYVKQGISSIGKQKFDKMVAARSAAVALPDNFDPANFFTQLTQTYPDACVYFFHLPQSGSWCGATPEKLLTVQKGLVETVALAGTMAAGSDAQWTDKEYDEQNMTEFFIEDVFAQLKLTGIRKTEVETIEAGSLKHLRSTISWKPKPEVLQLKFHKLLAAINPTPAVCGLPQFEASLFISQNEQLERRFYSGFIGLMKPKEAHLYVNLRCMELGSDKALLYAGAGITEDSNPEAEWNETQRKMDILGSLLKG